MDSSQIEKINNIKNDVETAKFRILLYAGAKFEDGIWSYVGTLSFTKTPEEIDSMSINDIKKILV